MKTTRMLPLIFGLSLAAATGLVQAQSTQAKAAQPEARAQVKMDRDDFLKSHRYDEMSSLWVLRAGMEPPMGVKSRAEVKAARDTFLSNNKWNEVTSRWAPVGSSPRDMSRLTRQQVRDETQQFMRTHRFDELSGAWVAKSGSAG